MEKFISRKKRRFLKIGIEIEFKILIIIGVNGLLMMMIFEEVVGEVLGR
jgi:hypothetical protein